MSELDRALKDYTKAIRLDPKSAVYHAARAEIWLEKNDSDRALSDLSTAIQLKPKADEFYAKRARLFDQKRDWDRAIEDWTSAIALDATNEIYFKLRADVLENKGLYDRAIADYDVAVRIDPDYESAIHNRGFSRNRKGDFDGAIADYTEAIRLRPNSGNSFRNRGESWVKKGDYARAIADFTEAIRLEPIEYAYRLRGDAYESSDQLELALADYDRAISLDPNSGLALNNRGYARHRKKDYGGAIEDYTRALAIREMEIRYTNRGDSWREKGDHPRARLDYEAALKINPKHKLAINGLALSYMATGDVNRAISSFDEVVRIDDQFYSGFYNRGLVYYRKGDLAKALSDFETVSKINAKVPAAYFYHGLILETLGDVERAKIDFASALSGSPDSYDGQWVHSAARARLAALEPARAAGPTQKREPATSQRRVALVIGNANYANLPTLKNPQRDAEKVADTFRFVGFDAVKVVTNVTRERLVSALRDFSRDADLADWAVIYFAGHGLEIGGINYLVPTDARLESDRDVQYEAISLDSFIGALDGARRLRLLLMDACRDASITTNMRRRLATRDVTRGFVQVEPSTAGTLIVSSAKPGQIAADGDGGNSPFVEALAINATKPDVEINKLWRLVYDDVFAKTNGRQEPSLYGTRSGEDYYFVSSK